jgi:hypothetical protein
MAAQMIVLWADEELGFLLILVVRQDYVHWLKRSRSK